MASDRTIFVLRSYSGMLTVLNGQKKLKTRCPRLYVSNFEAVGANVFGTVMDNIDKGKDRYYGYKYE